MIRALSITFLAAISAVSAAEHTDAYAAAKLPALSREWHSADYQAVVAAISKGEVPLPKLSSEPSAKLFKKIASLDNLALANNTTLPLDYRLQEMVVLLPTVASLSKSYMAEANRGEKVNGEIAALLVFLLHGTAAQARIVEEFIPTIPHDEKYSVRMDGLALVRSGATNVFLGLVTSLSERSFYSDDDISLMLQAMADTLPSLKQLFAHDFRVELHNKLSAYLRLATRPKDLKNLDRMLAELKV
jgi:hypothetical protein